MTVSVEVAFAVLFSKGHWFNPQTSRMILARESERAASAFSPRYSFYHVSIPQLLQ